MNCAGMGTTLMPGEGASLANSFFNLSIGCCQTLAFCYEGPLQACFLPSFNHHHAPSHILRLWALCPLSTWLHCNPPFCAVVCTRTHLDFQLEAGHARALDLFPRSLSWHKELPRNRLHRWHRVQWLSMLGCAQQWALVPAVRPLLKCCPRHALDAGAWESAAIPSLS